MAELNMRPVTRFTEYTIRPVKRSDGPLIDALQYRANPEWGLPGLHQESLQIEKLFFENLTENEHLWLVETPSVGAEARSLMAYAHLSVEQKPRFRHGGHLSTLVDPRHRQLPVEKPLIEKILNLADDWLMLLRVQVEIFASDERSLLMYQELGFVKEGVRRYAIVRDGQYCDLQILARYRF